VWRRLADVSKAQKRLGFKTQVSLEQGLRDLVAWWKALPKGEELARPPQLHAK
jgi:nucleoside-diphosphate-sugar epimerase